MDTHDWAQQEANRDSEIRLIYSVIEVLYEYSPFSMLNIQLRSDGYTFTIDDINFYIKKDIAVCGWEAELYELSIEELKQLSEYLKRYSTPDYLGTNPYHDQIMDINKPIEEHINSEPLGGNITY
jgi:hypothetical protein